MFGEVLRMVQVVATLEPGGAQLSVLRVSRALRARGIETRLLCGSANPAGIALAGHHGFTPEIYGERDLQWHAEPSFAEWLAPRLLGTDVVHGHTFGAWWAAARAAEPGVPLVASEHGPFAWPGTLQVDLLREGLSRVDRFYAHGPNARATVLAAGLPAARVRRGLSPVLGLDAHPRPWLPVPRLMYADRLCVQTGPDLLLGALALLPKPPVCFVLGSGPAELALRRRAAREDLRGRVHFCGRRRDPAPWIAGASAVVVPSREEGSLQAAILGMGLGVPVVGTRVEGLTETLADNRGLAVAPENPEALASAIAAALSGERRTDLGGARRWARQFGLEAVAGTYEEAYRELASRPVLDFAAESPLSPAAPVAPSPA